MRLFGHDLPQIRCVESVPAATAMIASGRAVTLAPPLMDIAIQGKVVFRPLVERAPTLKVELRAVWRKGSLSPLGIRFLHTLPQAARRKHAPSAVRGSSTPGRRHDPTLAAVG